MEEQKKYKIVYVTPALYMAGGVERVLTLKANYFAEQLGYDITIILTEGKDKPYFYPLSPKVKVINFDLNFEELWTCSFLKKVRVYLPKQRRFKKLLTAELMRIRPDITISLLRRDINFINSINDGSKKIGELHVNRINYRQLDDKDKTLLGRCFEYFWKRSLLAHVKHLDKFVVLTRNDRNVWPELNDVVVIPLPLPFMPESTSSLIEKRVVAVGRYHYQKGFDLLLKAWQIVEKKHPDWQLAIFGQGDREPYVNLASHLGLDMTRCNLYSQTDNILDEYCKSSIFVLSSRYEGFGMVLIEAMACGLPCVSFDCPYGPSDIIKDGEDGYLVDYLDVQAFADGICKLIESPELRENMGKQGRRNVLRFSKETVMQQWVDLFEMLTRREDSNGQ